MALDYKFRNVVLLGLGFMLVFTAFQTMGNIQVCYLATVPQHNFKIMSVQFKSNSNYYKLFLVLK